jgi:hypothetical protein
LRRVTGHQVRPQLSHPNVAGPASMSPDAELPANGRNIP